MRKLQKLLLNITTVNSKEQPWKDKLVMLSSSITNKDGHEMQADTHKSRTSWKKRNMTKTDQRSL